MRAVIYDVATGAISQVVHGADENVEATAAQCNGAALPVPPEVSDTELGTIDTTHVVDVGGGGGGGGGGGSEFPVLMEMMA